VRREACDTVVPFMFDYVGWSQEQSIGDVRFCRVDP